VAGYVAEFVPMSLYGVGTAAGAEWLSAWTGFYWAWWLSWAPFVGLFLARVSRGRRIRTVVAASVGATSLATLVWFVVVGGPFAVVAVVALLGLAVAIARDRR